eukprot:49888_1
MRHSPSTATPYKVNVGVGAYRSTDDAGLSYVTSSPAFVRRKSSTWLDSPSLNHENLGIAGDATFVKLAMEFVYCKGSKVLEDNCVAVIQTLSGTGGELLRNGGHKEIYVPNPTWGIHIPIFQNAGLEVKKYRYYDAGISGLEFDNLIADFKAHGRRAVSFFSMPVPTTRRVWIPHWSSGVRSAKR